MTCFRMLSLAFVTFAVAASGQTHEVAIMDPVLQMRAWTLVNVPNGWATEGTMMPGSSCNNATTPIYRSISPGGESGVYFLPRVDWVWGAAARPSEDCLPFQARISASEFLHRFIDIRGLEFVQEERTPDIETDLRESRERDRAMPQMKASTDLARFRVRYAVNGQPREEWLDGRVVCSENVALGVGRQARCSAFVIRRFAPQGRLDAMGPTLKGFRLQLNQPWMNAWTAAMVNRVNRLSEQQTQALLEQGRLAQAGRMQQHRDFMANMRSQGEARNDDFKRGQYAKQRNKEDYVDYILDCQRLSNGTIRVSVGSNCPTRQTGW